ncbi:MULTISPECIES: malate dehydrogenase (quinone) [Rhodococcus]|jgi:malate dehydrogenase (quinone)|uniref:Probable malate:quinone oxidoreductase n=1 Tax=Rhodococcus oxybenzonivorans TaxID=1990687 RepID=A0AAE4UVZ1_9NOCA|nr:MULTISPECIES: malate dehydrogenase (quinone) [Rhodococcus]MDV7244853.1 malate dehydrogenase (quinone) [Rhodococcus oxybenzonivorans]MDV7263652.1 malate dehydrogenase (quinone) [Rhodococcus oxybenzonivorans]MDV7275648.1 malate dehydrogenase (quinone) [Rhodococcus oxybenzonivorans]MDV7332425.1 malate dehydrogenase (quinone) [Rhodococcus oxybenzonivorans]MDV7346221.1 malate dehydrogenase (quinone) [Rhodococcus oxybenzonivorans]
MDKEVDSPVSDQNAVETKTDVVLVGAGIMSATLGAILRQVQPDWSITTFERLDAVAAESSDPWNNAGTGHSALCELNYTPENPDGTVEIAKAVNVNEQFQVSRQFWAHAVENGVLTKPKEFINPIPHVSFVHGEANVKYLRARYDALAGHPLFAGMEYVEDPVEFARRLPLMAKGRDYSDPIALNWTENGTDVDFGALTKQLLGYVGASGGIVHFGHEVTDLTKQSDGSWVVKVTNRRNGAKKVVRSKFVFVGAGGGALHLLQKSGISEAKGFGGFPVSGAFLRCTNPELIDQHRAKVYGKAAVGAPPMSVPHLDTRVIGSKPGLLFGPYAGWSPKFLKEGRVTDLPGSVKPDNLLSMLGVGVSELGLVKYLISELTKSEAGRIDTLREFVPKAVGKDWELITAGQRVQVIRRAKGKGGVLEFGTAVVNAADGSIAGLLGASPGASTAVPAMLDVLERCFPDRYESWKPKLQEMVPSLGVKLTDEPGLFAQVWEHTSKVLQLDTIAVEEASVAAV